MKPWLKIGSLAATLAFLAACSSGIRQDTLDSEEANLSTQAIVVTSSVPDSASDAEENGGQTSISSTILELGYRTSSTSDKQTVGLRFANINVPKGTTVTNAYIEFVAPLKRSEVASLQIYGDNVANAQPFKAGSNDVSGRAKTEAKVVWEPGVWLPEKKYASPNLAPIVKEITSRQDWVEGSAIAFMLSGTGQRKAYAYEAPGARQPVLRIYYKSTATNPPPPTDPPPTASKSCLENVNRIVADPQKGKTYFVKRKGTNVEIDARGKEFFVLNNGSAKPMQIQNNGSGLCISGGKYSTLVKDDAIWEPDFHFGAAFYIDESPNLVMDNIAIDISGDGFSIHDDGRGTENWVVRDSYIRHSGDDAFEVDKMSGLIDDVLVDWTYQGVSCRNPDNTRTPGTITIQDSLFALKKQAGTYNNFKDGTYPKNPGHLHPFKLETKNDRNCKLRLRNTVFYLTQNGGGNTVFWSRQEPTKYVLECKNVTLVYVGGTTYKDEGGRLAALRDRFGASCFKIQNQGESIDKKLAFWKAKRNEWFDRHTNNSQISYYRNREPQGVN